MFRVLRPGGQIAVSDSDYNILTMAISSADPVQSCARAFVAAYVNTPGSWAGTAGLGGLHPPVVAQPRRHVDRRPGPPAQRRRPALDAGRNHQVRHRRLHTEELTMSTPAATSIYDSIGGEPALVAVVDDLYQRVTADPELAGFFAGTNMAKLKGRQVEFFAAALGGPQAYTGATMREAHRGRGIGQKHFNLVAGHLIAALSAADVPDKTINDITGLLGLLAEDIVSRAGS